MEKVKKLGNAARAKIAAQERLEEAKSRGLILIGPALGVYKHQSAHLHYLLPCGHTQDIKACHVKVGKFRCQSCVKENHIREARLLDLELIDHAPTDDADYKLYKSKSCGHERVMPAWHISRQVEKGFIECQICVSDRRFEAAERNGLVLIADESEKWMYRKYAYKLCGHEQYMKIQDIAKDIVPSCETCRITRLHTEASDRGLTLLKMNVEKEKHLYELPCGCTKAFKAGNIRRDVWACDNHSYLNKDAYLYVLEFIEDDFSWVKIGKSINVADRIKNIESAAYCEALYISPKRKSHEILKIEDELHKQFSKVNLEYDIMKFKMKNGWTECYDISSKYEILNKVRSIFNE